MHEPGLLNTTVRDKEWIEDLDVRPGQRDVLLRIQRLEDEIRADPTEWRLRLCAAQAYVSNGDFTAAVRHLRACRELVSHPPAVAGVFFNLGVCLENLNLWQEAALAYQQCLFIIPDLYWAHYNLGTCWMHLAEWPRAIAAFNDAAAIDDGNPELHRALRDAFHGAGMDREAHEAHGRLLALHAPPAPFERTARPN